jgi:hypothetical protein
VSPPAISGTDNRRRRLIVTAAVIFGTVVRRRLLIVTPAISGTMSAAAAAGLGLTIAAGMPVRDDPHPAVADPAIGMDAVGLRAGDENKRCADGQQHKSQHGFSSSSGTARC